MQQRIKGWLLRLGLWLAKLGGASPDVLTLGASEATWAARALTLAARLPQGALELREAAHKVCWHLETTANPGTSGEWKRHQAIARLTKQFPEAATRDIALAIELVMPLVKGG